MRVPPKVAQASHSVDAPSPTQDTSNLEALYAAAGAAQVDIRKMTQVMVRAGCGRIVDDCCIKEVDRARQKIDYELGGRAENLCDIVRIRASFPTVAALYQGVEAALEQFPQAFVRVRNRFPTPKANGYADFSINLRATNRHIGEAQLHVDPFLAASKIERVVYNDARLLAAGIVDTSPALLAMCEATSAAIYDIAAKAVRENRPLSEDEHLRMESIIPAMTHTAAAFDPRTQQRR